MLQAVDGATIRAWMQRAAESLVVEQAALDAINVFPVADGDTGTNLAATLRAAADALAELPDPPELSAALHTLATAAVRGARGSSGVIVSQLLRGLADTADGSKAVRQWDGGGVGRALNRAADAAWAAVAAPVEGTMLSVARAVATATSAGTATDLHVVLDVACRAARDALNRTPSQLPVLADNGVVDAGARGLVLVLDALRQVVTGVEPDQLASRFAASPAAPQQASCAADGPGYEVMYLLRLPPAADPGGVLTQVRAALAPLGDSLVVADDGTGQLSVHIHVDDVGAAVEAGAAAAADGGRMHQVKITRFADRPPGSPEPRKLAVVVHPDTVGPARAVFGGEHLTVLAPGEPLPAGELVLVAVADIPVPPARAGLSVLPVHSLPQAIAAVAVHDPGRASVDDTVAMAEAAGACRFGELSVAESEGLTMAGRCHAGDVLGHLAGDIAVIGSDPGAVACELLDRLLAPGGELVTILHADGQEELAERLTAHARSHSDHIEVTVTPAGAMSTPVMIGVE